MIHGMQSLSHEISHLYHVPFALPAQSWYLICNVHIHYIGLKHGTLCTLCARILCSVHDMNMHSYDVYCMYSVHAGHAVHLLSPMYVVQYVHAAHAVHACMQQTFTVQVCLSSAVFLKLFVICSNPNGPVQVFLSFKVTSNVRICLGLTTDFGR